MHDVYDDQHAQQWDRRVAVHSRWWPVARESALHKYRIGICAQSGSQPASRRSKCGHGGCLADFCERRHCARHLAGDGDDERRRSDWQQLMIMRMMLRTIQLTAVCLVFAGTAGCSPDSGKGVVEGTVTLDG